MRTCAGPVAARPPATATSIAAVRVSTAAKTALVIVTKFLISSREGHPDEALDPASVFHKRALEPAGGLSFFLREHAERRLRRWRRPRGSGAGRAGRRREPRRRRPGAARRRGRRGRVSARRTGAIAAGRN